MPTRTPPPESPETAAPAQEAPVAMPGETTPEAMPGTPAATLAPNAPAAAPAPDWPEPIIFQRGDFSFNRRFFETKFANFCRLVPSHAEKDLVLVIESSRGRFVGRRIIRITPNELYLQVAANNATADEMIPFTEIAEVQIRHKDSL
jgi:hypothetical protein